MRLGALRHPTAGEQHKANDCEQHLIGMGRSRGERESTFVSISEHILTNWATLGWGDRDWLKLKRTRVDG
jgi:hypothetical protein